MSQLPVRNIKSQLERVLPSNSSKNETFKIYNGFIEKSKNPYQPWLEWKLRVSWSKGVMCGLFSLINAAGWLIQF